MRSVKVLVARALDSRSRPHVVYMHDKPVRPRHRMLSERYILENCACGKVRMAARALTRRYDDALRPAGLRATQFALLVAISANGAQSIAALAKELGMDRST